MAFLFSSVSDNVTMALEGGTCHGTIYLQRNTEKTAVCYADEKIGQIACKEMECGGFLKTYQRPISGYGWKLSCKDHAQSLWHCQRSQASCGQQSQAIMCSGKCPPLLLLVFSVSSPQLSPTVYIIINHFNYLSLHFLLLFKCPVA